MSISGIIRRLTESDNPMGGDYSSLRWDDKLDRIIMFKDHKDEYNIKENGRAYIVVEHAPWFYTARQLGYRNEGDIKKSINDDNWPSKLIVQMFEKYYKDPMEIKLLDWHADKLGSGFGRTVMIKILELARKYKADALRVFLPSIMAQDILNHYVDVGFLAKEDMGINKSYKINLNYNFKETK